MWIKTIKGWTSGASQDEKDCPSCGRSLYYGLSLIWKPVFYYDELLYEAAHCLCGANLIVIND